MPTLPRLTGRARALDARARRWLLAALLAVLLLGGAWLWFMPRGEPAAPELAQTPDFQRSGPLANPWGGGVPVLGADAAAQAASAPASQAASAPASAATPGRGAATPARAPPTRDSLREALAALHAADTAGAFVAAAIERGETSALAVAWMAERHCRQRLHWQSIARWRQRAGQTTPSGGGTAGGTQGGTHRGAATGAGVLARCDALPDAAALDAALAAAGFAPTAEHIVELTRRPLDLPLALSVGDPLLVAEVVDASPQERITALLRASGVDPRDLLPEVQRPALWLASCAPRDARGQPIVNSSALHPACREHPALWQACVHEGLCDVRDLRDLLLRTLPADLLAASERLARVLAARVAQ